MEPIETPANLQKSKYQAKLLFLMVPGGGFEPPTRGFSVLMPRFLY
jgi:hypothetical protein